ncbi:hypothetical protein BXY57_1143 [Thermoflavifilum aggregans]|uniref:Pentapeptide MXKDX repeat protein n=1 Tax=Thermoflavifilum aggregans TaxID=454188 RepID=A0A2M9CUH4_9BACT|nr:hypothetical protein [Thermoflavifilum aggregans]PJJ75564.1 hypothetical protein BXY57_1143 [Thermoflavifilum aggregans]
MKKLLMSMALLALVTGTAFGQHVKKDTTAAKKSYHKEHVMHKKGMHHMKKTGKDSTSNGGK